MSRLSSRIHVVSDEVIDPRGRRERTARYLSDRLDRTLLEVIRRVDTMTPVLVMRRKKLLDRERRAFELGVGLASEGLVSHAKLSDPPPPEARPHLTVVH
jgi:hypothetical protein